MASVINDNAHRDQAAFRGWLIGDLSAWRGEEIHPGGDLRSTRAVEVKWGVLRRGEQQPGGWASACECVTLSLLLRGQFTLFLRDAQSPQEEIAHEMQKEGDYLLWGEQVEHTWRADQDSIILAARWPAER